MAKRLLPVMAIAVVLLATANPAQGAERATLTWDTDQTDIDLHIWDSSGAHAWFGEQTGVPDAELSTDIIYGYGPEHFVEGFSGAAGETYTYGICYFGSNRDDDTVPETIATVDVIDPNGQTRTFKRTLRAEKEAYYLGSSPQGSAYIPDDDWCAQGPYRPASDAGPDPDTATGGGGSFEGCPRVRRRIGVVELCANQFTGGGPVYTATGNVRVNGSVYLGEGPISVDVDSRTIRSSGPTSIAVMRGGKPFPIASGEVFIDAKPETDAVSGRGQLAGISVGDVRADLQALTLAGLPLSAADLTGNVLKLYLDRLDGGGIIAQARVRLPFAGGLPSAGALAVGVHGSSASAVRALGGTASFGHVALPGGWSFDDFTLTYQETGNVWQASGGLTTPFFGLDLTGALSDGQPNAIGVSVSRDVPIGPTGFVMTKLGGSVEGLATPPVKIAATASARWGSVPGIDAAVLLLNDVKFEVDLSGSASLKGDVTFLRNPSPVKGSIDVSFAISPFRASGQLTADAKVGAIDVNAGGGIVMRPAAFTAAGGASGRLRGIKLTSGRGVVSNRGIGITGKLCMFRACSELGLGMDWKDFPAVRYVGSDVQQFVTASSVATAAAASRTIVVKSDRPFLFVDADGPDGSTPAFRVRSPDGRLYNTKKSRNNTRVVRDPSIGFTGLTIATPRRGRWTVTPLGASRRGTQFVSQTVRKTSRVRVSRVKPRGSRRKPLSQKGGTIRVDWSSKGLPAGTKVNVYVTPGSTQLGQFVVGGKRARTSFVRIPRSFLRKGANRIRLVVLDKGIAIDDVIARGAVVWAK